LRFSCAAADSCVAVGTPYGTVNPAAAEPIRARGGHGAILAGVSCSAPNACPATDAAASAPKAKKVTCTFRIKSQSPPQALTGYDLGFVSCPGFFGDGLHWDSFTVTPAAPNVTIHGPFKDFFNRGTIHGSFELHGTLTSATVSGPIKVLGGTGAFEHIRGHGRLECGVGTDSQTACTATLELNQT
ncbi:MAG: hypothetical protein M3018_13985, partial [Actinomycetota bacterium]|nr:hypothetical protein [Actinomycetota bacterium]